MAMQSQGLSLTLQRCGCLDKENGAVAEAIVPGKQRAVALPCARSSPASTTCLCPPRWSEAQPALGCVVGAASVQILRRSSSVPTGALRSWLCFERCRLMENTSRQGFQNKDRKGLVALYVINTCSYLKTSLETCHSELPSIHGNVIMFSTAALSSPVL